MYRRGRLIPTYRPSPTSEGRAACAVRTPLLIVRGFAPDALPEACSPFTKTNTGILSYSGHTGPSSPLAHLPISPSDDQHLQIPGILFWPRYVCGGGWKGWAHTGRIYMQIYVKPLTSISQGLRSPQALCGCPLCTVRFFSLLVWQWPIKV